MSDLYVYKQIDPSVLFILILVFSILIFFTSVFHIWKHFKNSSFVRLMLTRTYSWWAILYIYILFFCIYPPLGHIGLAIISFLSFREIINHSSFLLIPKKLLWICYFIIGFQFLTTALSQNLMSILIIPFVGFLLINIYTILFEDIKTAVQAPPYLFWTMMLTSSGLAHLSFLYSLHPQINAQGLLIYFIFLTQFNDVLQFIWGTLFGKHLIAPTISPKKTWQGLLGAIFTTMFIAYLLRFLTPLNQMQSLIIGFIIPIFGFWGDLAISCLKRNLKVKDFGTIIPGHGGILDRVDSILLASIVYFYLIFFWVLK